MKINFKQPFIIFLILGLTVINLYVFLNALFPNQVSLTKQSQPDTAVTNNLKQLKLALDSLKIRQPLTNQSLNSPPPATNMTHLMIKIFNANGVTGRANSIKENLSAIQGLDVVIDNNAEATGTTSLRVKPGVSDEVKNTILGILSKEFSHINEEKLASDSSSDIEIVLGSKP